MKDKIDEMFEILGNNKKNLIFIIIAYAVITLVIIAIIWWPKEKEYIAYEKINMETKKTEQAKNYMDRILYLFKNARKEELKQLVSKDYINYTEKNVDQIIAELDAKKFFSNNVEVKGGSVYVDEDTYIYSTTIYNGNNSRAINIIESYPYEYEIVFDDFYKYTELYKVSTTNDIQFTVKDIYRNLKYIEMNVEIKNLNDTYAKFDFNSTIGVQAILQDGTAYTLSNNVSFEEYTDIQPNMTIKKNFVFEIPAQLQEGLEYILFNDVSIKFSKVDLKFNI